jgi:hypothetical protein
MYHHVASKRPYLFTHLHGVLSWSSPLISHNIKLYTLKVADEYIRMSVCLRMKLAGNLNIAQAVRSTAGGTDGMNGTVTGDEN